MSDRLSSLKERLEAKDCVLVFAAESGSRAWGFESPDSDYDIRFVFAYKSPGYLAIEDPFKDLDYMITQNGEKLDFAGWDLKKALKLAYGSNPSLLEWLRSPIIYEDNYAFRTNLLKHLEKSFSQKALGHHYISFMRNIRGKYLQNATGEYSAKRYFYALRPIFAILWMKQYPGQLPPIRFKDLLHYWIPTDVLSHVEALMHIKSQGIEDSKWKSNTLDTYIAQWYDTGHSIVDSFPGKNQNMSTINHIFRVTLGLVNALNPQREEAGKTTWV